MDHVGKYEIREQIGRGGMGAVYRAYDPVMEREVALKVILDIALDVPEIKERFYREARTAGKLTHENITIIHDVGEENGRPFIVMEYLPGSDLRTLLERPGALTFQTKLSIASQVCRGLAYSHGKDIVHRDVKPANIRILENGRVKLMDFGIARLGSSALTSTGTVLGTPYYMSPEQIQGKKVDRRSDIFSCGVVLYELFTSSKPFGGEEPTSVMYKIVHEEPEGFDELKRLLPPALPVILEKMLRKDPLQRYQDMDQVVSAFEGLAEDVRELELRKRPPKEVREKRAAPQAPAEVAHEASTILAEHAAEAPVSEAPGKRIRVGGKVLAASILGVLIVAAILGYLLYPTSPTGTVMLTILPWANITAIQEDGGGNVALPEVLTTPCRMSLPPGRYAVTCAHPDYARPMVVKFVVQADSISDVVQSLPGYNVEQILSRY